MYKYDESKTSCINIGLVLRASTNYHLDTNRVKMYKYDESKTSCINIGLVLRASTNDQVLLLLLQVQPLQPIGQVKGHRLNS